MRNITSRLADERGTAVVEFALVLPVLALILFGILDFGRAMNYWNDLNQMAANGARSAAVNVVPPAVNSCSATDMAGRIACQADTATLRNGTGQVTSKATVTIYTTGKVGTPVKICAAATYRPFAILGIGPTLRLKGSAVMRVEQTGTYTATGTDPTTDCS